MSDRKDRGYKDYCAFLDDCGCPVVVRRATSDDKPRVWIISQFEDGAIARTINTITKETKAVEPGTDEIVAASNAFLDLAAAKRVIAALQQFVKDVDGPQIAVVRSLRGVGGGQR